MIRSYHRYKNSQEKILCKCKICGFEWEVIPNNLLRGRSCPNCAKEIRANKKRKDINNIKGYFDNFEGWMEAEDRMNEYDDYTICFYDIEKHMLYYIHSNI